ncbi:nardilysin-like [Pogonomyrmex barbatus]|uniref:Nardilysin-like n=1 Tax=Pogonomyrmex barbatus TaxID=144034 RepID=A0A6I9WJ16_9HYME|nr:nardilysin-like [Pogonomyrmex barbatus]
MAHFLEHMVFMGSEKYPQENDFDAYISKRGGFTNASTDCEHTTFYFDIQEKHLLSTLDRFAQFFIKPLMKKEAITREREAIESEFQLALPNDENRKEQLFSSFAQTGHPASKFVWGNLVTLRDNVHDDKLYEELHKFRERHYSAHRMRLAVQARLPLDTLEKYVTMCFADVPNNGLPPSNFIEFKGGVSFDTPAFRKIYKVKPFKDVSQVCA